MMTEPITVSDATARRVAGRLRLNGDEVAFVSLQVESNGCHSADTFSATLPLSGLPPSMSLTGWWAEQRAIRVEIDIGLARADAASLAWRQLIVGQVDQWRYAPGRHVLEIEGRDLTARLIDSRLDEKFANRTTSQVATLLAERHELKPVVTATTTQVGTLYKYDQSHLSGDSSEWELLSYFAGLDGFQVYVRGDTLYYAPAIDPDSAQCYPIRHAAAGAATARGNVSDDLTFERDMTLSRGIQVQVKSWFGGRTVAVGYPARALAGAQIYKVLRSGLDQRRAATLAEKLYGRIAERELSLSCSLPGDNLLMPDMMVAVQGTGSGFDQNYYVDRVKRTLDSDNGYVMHLSASNRDPANQETS
jgi:phage protein D